MMETAGDVAAFIIFDQITGTFIEVSFSGICQRQEQNFSFTEMINSKCPFGINLNVAKYNQRDRLMTVYLHSLFRTRCFTSF